MGTASVGFGGCVWNFFGKPRVAKSLLFNVIESSIEFNAYHDKSIHSFLTCSLCLLTMGSECVWAFGEGSNFQLVRGPQN